ncbi:hypothetical protein [Actinoplanes sp. NBRC 101535]|uniref:hypothetical protein n=1 Tax=Actinoplanes sp. NBRC 101535 TaxID=3032196 RepID=UPI0024A0B162|nr:hypothetical protein [Actinoplanes sp. NBRC 101535]GLY07106.1 hypothetical protein Acsp01_74850 [Actinoplanes sp. NBRC 101535]
MPPVETNRARVARRSVLAAVCLGSLAAAVWGKPVLGGLSVVTGAVIVAQEWRVRRPEEDLASAVDAAWPLPSGGTIALRWMRDADLSHPDAAAPDADPSVRYLLDGADPERAAARLAALFRRVPERRLVIVGEGARSMAVLLLRGLLADRADGDPVPVLLDLASWDPGAGGLTPWIRRQVADLHLGGRRDVAAALVDRGKLMIILDGLDTLPGDVAGELDRYPAVVLLGRSGVRLDRAPAIRLLPRQRDSARDRTATGAAVRRTR